jgi:hypothetical protein
MSRAGFAPEHKRVQRQGRGNKAGAIGYLVSRQGIEAGGGVF